MDKRIKTLLIHIGLFVLTLITTTFAGTEWTLGKFVIFGIEWDDFLFGLQFSIPFLGILTFHEFGHYFTAKYHNIKVTLPYYLPVWLGFLAIPSLGTMGAFIRIKESITSRTKYFDVGVSGPVAGFIVAIILYVVGFRTLPETAYIYEIHPEYELFGENFEEKMMDLDTIILKKDLNPSRMAYNALNDTIRTNQSGSISFGNNLLMTIGRNYLAPNDRYIPSADELMHYPLLLASFLAFFFTALNLLPMGQLDGGHILFGLVGAKNHAIISRILFIGFLFYAGLGLVTTSSLENSSLISLGSFLLWTGAYLYFLYYCLLYVFKEKRERFLYATVLFTIQFFIGSIFKIEGYTGWLLFIFIIGRVIGLDHPPVVENGPLTVERKVLGWIALIIFVLCFSPQPLVVDEGF
ncbi:MAG: site-2 protease family protein [Bacteroidota bacterium]